MSISRRNVLATGAAAITTAAVTAPLALKAALGDEIPTVDPVLAVEQEWRAFHEYIRNHPDESDAARAPLYDRLTDMEIKIYETPATTPAGIAVKLRLWGGYYGPFYGRSFEEPWWRGDRATMGIADTGFACVMCDLERLTGEARPT